MKNVIVQNASDFTEVCKPNFNRVSSHLMVKQQLKKVEYLDLWSVSPEVKDISKAHAAVVNTNRVFRFLHDGFGWIWHIDQAYDICHIDQAYEMQSLIFQSYLCK